MKRINKEHYEEEHYKEEMEENDYNYDKEENEEYDDEYDDEYDMELRKEKAILKKEQEEYKTKCMEKALAEQVDLVIAKLIVARIIKINI
jgi:hypothetical protein